MNALGALARRRGVDALIAVAALASALEVSFRHDAKLPKTSVWFAAPAAAVIVLVLLGWRAYGFISGAALWLVAAGVSGVDSRIVVSTVAIQAAGLGAAYLLGNGRDQRQAQAGLAVLLVGAVVVVSNDPNRTASEYAFVPGLFAVAWAAGFIARQRTAQSEKAVDRAARLELEQASIAAKVVAEERTRIARELHDVVGHCVSVMTVQASAVRRVLAPEQEQEREALQSVEKVGREALAEMRRLVGILRESADTPDLAPPPTLRDLDVLISHAQASGLEVEVSVDGDPSNLPVSIDLTAYRIVQEGLTNAIRHAHANLARVAIRCRSGSLEIEVTDDGIGLAGSQHRPGHGLLGMRERVDVFGGRLDVGPLAAGGYRLRARLPVPT